MISSSIIIDNYCQIKEWNKKKKIDQYCKFPICKNEKNLLYCSIHLPLNEVGPHGKMIQCSQCNQIMGEQLINRHMPKCNKNKIEKVISDDNIITPRKWHQKNDKVSDIPLEIINSLRQKISALYQSLKLNIIKREIIPDTIDLFFTKQELEGKNSKNITQEASIIENMIKEEIFPVNGLYIELGCGAGSFSKTIQRFCNYTSSHLLIDRMKYSSRNKYDHLIKDKISNNYFERLIIDIKDFDITQYDHNHDNIIAVSKHLCGNACDLSLSLFSNNEYKYKKIKRISLAIATCCHYLLNSDNFINIAFFHKNNFTNDEFNVLARLTSWSTLKEESDNYFFGKKIKEIIDYARIEYLLQKGYKGSIIEYTSKTKENHLLIAYKDNHYS